MRPNFEDPLDTAKQLVEKNIILCGSPGAEMWKQFLIDSPIPEYKILGENFIIAVTWNHYWSMSQYNIIEDGTHAKMTSYLNPWEKSLGERGWHRSKEKVSGKYPYSGFLTNKKWQVNEVMCKLIKIPYHARLHVKFVKRGYNSMSRFDFQSH